MSNNIREDEVKMIRLEQDSGRNCIKRTVELEEESLYYELKKHFKWRKGDFKERYFKLGTSQFDNFIEILINKGYREIKLKNMQQKTTK